ncbi:hypothetical protein ACSP97_17545 [Streptomyces sp. SCPE 10]|uniref:hypothetical protein n=1 Tax=unclassified Streptomyces TaxID=2593676 RepID=UPI003F4AA8EB
MSGRTPGSCGNSTARRAVAAAVVAATSLILAANACPARATVPSTPAAQATVADTAARR